MPKMKTKKAVAAKFKVTGTGKLVHHHPGKRHLLTRKSAKRKRQLGRPAVLSDAFTKTYKNFIGA